MSLVNKKRIERLWRREGLQVPPRKVKASGQKAIGEDASSTRRLPARYRNHIWSYDFIKRRTSDGRPVRVLNVIDEFTRVGVGSHVARGIGAKGVREHLEKLFEIHGVLPPVFRSTSCVVARDFESARGGV